MKTYQIGYKLFPYPWWYTFTVKAENSEKAISAFLHDCFLGVETYRIISIESE